MVGKIVAGVIAGIVGLLLLTVLFGSWFTIDQGELGVVLRNGAVSHVAQPGLGFKLPIADTVVHVSTRTEKLTWDKMESYSQDQQPAQIKVSINYRVDPSKVVVLYSQFGLKYWEAVLWPIVPKEFKVAFGQFNAVAAVTDRAKLNTVAEKYIRESVTELSGGKLIIESVNVEDIKFSPEYEKSVEQRMLAEVEVARLRQNAEREKVQAQIAVTQAQGRADAVRAEADAAAYRVKAQGDADAYATVQKGNAEASAIEAQGSARARYMEQQAVVLKDPLLVIDAMNSLAWDGKLPTTMLPDGAVPFISTGR